MTVKIAKSSFTRINNILHDLGLKYHDSIPLDTIFDAAKAEGLIPLQEDNTEWDGFLCGAEGRCIFPVGTLDSRTEVNGLDTYIPYRNNAIALTWYKMPSGRYEIVSYI